MSSSIGSIIEGKPETVSGPDGAVNKLIQHVERLRGGARDGRAVEKVELAKRDFSRLPSGVQALLRAEGVETAADVKATGYKGLMALGLNDSAARAVGVAAGLIKEEAKAAPKTTPQPEPQPIEEGPGIRVNGGAEVDAINEKLGDKATATLVNGRVVLSEGRLKLERPAFKTYKGKVVKGYKKAFASYTPASKKGWVVKGWSK